MIPIRTAWALVDESGDIPENCDEPRFLCVFKTKAQAQGARISNEKLIKVVIAK